MQRTIGNARVARLLQRSPLSDDLEKQWAGGQGRDAVLARLRALPPGSAAKDADALAWAEKRLAQDADALWMAKTILAYGPEPLWPADALAARGQHGGGAGAVQATLGTTAGKQSVEAFFFQGTSAERALVIAGVHGSERQGMQVAQMLIADLAKAQPFFTVIVVPSLFPDNRDAGPVGTREGKTHTNRNFPAGGKTLDESRDDKGVPRDKNGKEILPENIMLMALMERFQPTRVISIHGTWDPSKAGIFSDPHSLSDSKRTELRRAAYRMAEELERDRPPAPTPAEQERRRLVRASEIEALLVAEAQRINKQRTLDDQQLAIESARAVAAKTGGLSEIKKRGGAVAGNRLDKPGKENATWGGGTDDGVSLGSYAPGRGMSVFTVEPAIDRNSGDYPSDKDPGVSAATREMELKAYAEAVETLLLGDPAKAKKSP